MPTHAVRATCERIEELLGSSHASRRVAERCYVVRQGIASMYVHVLPW